MPPPTQDDVPRRTSRKLHKKHRERSRVPTIQLPDVLRRTSDAGDEDITRPRGANVAMFANMNQSIVGMLAAAGSAVDYNDRFEGNSSDEEDDDSQRQPFSRPTGVAQTTVLSTRRVSRHRHKISGNMIKSLAALPRLATKKSSKSAPQRDRVDEHAQDLVSPASEVTEADEYRIAPVMSRMIEARDEMSSRPSFDIERKSDEGLAEEGPSKLARKLKDIFMFDQYEDVIAEYPCWLLQNVLLQGYMYITQKHICFYSYLPKKRHEVAKTGFLAKTGKRNPKYTRYWFRLKGDVLAYYKDAANPYFPHNQIDLRFAISACVSDKDKERVHFTVETHHRTYFFKADSPQSAKEWVKSLQRVIFRSHNDGDSVKISLPILNVVDIENSPMLDFAETCKIRVYDNDETFAIDEYFFSFFHPGSDAFNVLKILVEGVQDGSDRPGLQGDGSGTSSHTPSERIKLESVRATLHSPVASSRGSGELARASTDVPRRSSFEDRPRKATQESSESYVDPSISNLVSSSGEPSASQILKGSEVFHSPTIRRSGSINRRKTKTLSIQTLRSDHIFLHKEPSPTIIGRAGQFASYLSNNTKRMSSLLATESMGYVEKVSGMWKGRHKHYDAPAALRTDEELNQDDEEQVALSNKRFQEHFALPESEKLVATYFASLFRVLPLYGKVYVSNRSFCFRSLVPGVRTQLVLPLKDVETATKEKGFRLGYHGVVLVIRGHEELFFEFSDLGARDDCVVTMLQTLEAARFLDGEAWQDEEQEMETALAERDGLHEAAKEQFPGHEEYPKKCPGAADILFDDPRASFLNFKPKNPLKITCLTIGSRGDVQPYIALCKGLLNEGHHPTIATHAEFQGWIEGHGIGFKAVAGDPSELMRIVIENGTFTLAFFREANTKFRSWLDELLISSWEACQGAEVLIESPSAMAGIHIAEKLQIPYFRAFTMPWTRTRAYPHAFVMPETKKGGAFNYMTYVMFDNVFWKAIAGQVNRWRHNYLELPSTNLDRLMPNKVPFMYNFSPVVVPPPLDFSDWIRVTGYWFLDEGKDWTPPEDLAAFIKKARDDGKKLVYVGFGSIIVNDPAKMTQEVVDAVLKADVRCILSKGWSDRLPGKAPPSGETVSQDTVVLPPEICQIKSAPHDWLFRQIDAAAHHGGSGTTGASLRAGIPTIIRPFFGDQFFFGARVEDLGVGIQLKKWGAVSFARALWEATNSQRMIDRARVLGERIREDNGVDNAIQMIYRDLEYSKSLIRSKAGKNAKPVDDDEVEEESWTFVRPDGGVEEVVEQDLEKSVILGTATGDPKPASLALGSNVLAQTAKA